MTMKATIAELADLWKMDKKAVYGLIQFLQGAGLVLSTAKRKVPGANGPGMLEVEIDPTASATKLASLFSLVVSKPQPKKEK